MWVGGARVSAAPLAGAVLTPHARIEMTRRGLSEEVVRTVLERPEQRWELRPGRHVLQSRVPMGDPAKAYVVRVFVDIDKSPGVVVTAYRSSKVAKYWREAP